MAGLLWAIGGTFAAACVLGPFVARRAAATAPPDIDDDGHGH
ncbi:MAG TPA: hypothetical protein VF796_22645 [Humisphaera sp.]